MIDHILGLWLLVCCQHFAVEYDFARAVALVESGGRCGPLGKGTFIGPFGIHKDFRRKWPIDNPFINTMIGVRALRGTDKRRVLKRYNAAFNEAYYGAVMAIYKKGKR